MTKLAKSPQRPEILPVAREERTDQFDVAETGGNLGEHRGAADGIVAQIPGDDFYARPAGRGPDSVAFRGPTLERRACLVRRRSPESELQLGPALLDGLGTRKEPVRLVELGEGLVVT